MVITNVTHASTAETFTIPANGALAFVAVINDYVMVQFIENKTTGSINYTTGSQNHVAILYSRVNTSLDLSTVGLNCVTDDGYNVVLDDNTPTDSQASMIILNKTSCDLDALYSKYSD